MGFPQVVGVNQPQMDLSPSDSVTTIILLHLMAPDMPPRRSDVRTLAPPDSIVAQLVDYQEGRLASLL